MLAPARRTDRVLSLLFVAMDMLAVPVVFLATYWIRDNLLSRIPGFNVSFSEYLAVIPVIWVLWLAVFSSAGLYRPMRHPGAIGELQPVAKAVLLLALALMAASYVTKHDFSRLMLFMFTALSLPASLAARAAARKLASVLAPGTESPRVLVVGTGEVASRVITSLRRLPGGRHVMAGVLAPAPGGTIEEVEGVRVVGCLADLPRLITSMRIDEVFFASPNLDRSRILEMISDIESEDVHFLLVSDLFEIATGLTGLDDLARLPIVDIGRSRNGLVQRFSKRVFDIAVSSVLIVLLSPLFVAIYAALLFGGRGSPIFRQTRIGLRGRPFTLLKFRTMKPETGEYEVAPLAPGDPRVTRIGRFLRKTSLDELPQLFNVLAGSMSLVGPRPEMPFMVEGYKGWQRKRLEVRPGLTGLWQIMGRKDLPLHENLEYDFYYIRNQSLMLDFSILVRTLATVLRGRGAF